jgi:hypothetical protein
MSIEQQNALDWYSAGVSRPGYQTTREVLVRVWQPGDGVRCSAANKQSNHPCDAPVAVVREVLVATPTTSRAQTSITRVACLRHLATRFGIDGTPEDAGSDQAALEELASRHWDEYQGILASRRQDLLRRRLSALPEELRDQVIEAMTAAEEGGES